MPTLAPPTFSDGVPANASNLNAALDELDLINGDLSPLNLKVGFEAPKRVIRRGAQTRTEKSSSTAVQFFTVTAAPVGTTDIIVGTRVFPAGGSVNLDLPPGKWSCVVNYNLEYTGEEVELLSRINNGPFTAVTESTNLTSGTFLVLIVDSSQWRSVDFSLRIRTLTASNFRVDRAAISVTAFRQT